MNDFLLLFAKMKSLVALGPKRTKNLFLEFSSYFMTSLGISFKLHFVKNGLFLQKKKGFWPCIEKDANWLGFM